MGITTHEKINDYIENWEKRCYTKGIPDEAPIQISDKVPSYKKICIALLKNDMNLTSLGYEPKKTKYYSMLKRIELSARNDGKPKQLKLF
jgi:predicted phosphoadenosine phosphosulfate sulfurtransferase